MTMHYILEGHTPRPASLDEIVSWAYGEGGSDRRRVALSGDFSEGSATVSTVFLVHDHNFFSRGAPILFETMVFGGDLDGECERYCTWDEAVVGHDAMVARVKVGER